MEGKKWSDIEVLAMWPQAEGELRGFQRALQGNSFLTASQLDMALHLAQVEFKRLQEKADQILAIDCEKSRGFLQALKSCTGLDIESTVKLEHHVESCQPCKELCITSDGNWACNSPGCHHPTFKAAIFCMSMPLMEV